MFACSQGARTAALGTFTKLATGLFDSEFKNQMYFDPEIKWEKQLNPHIGLELSKISLSEHTKSQYMNKNSTDTSYLLSLKCISALYCRKLGKKNKEKTSATWMLRI